MFGTIMVWILLGILAGTIVALIFPNSKKYIVGTVSFGIIGAIVGGIFYSAFQVGSAAYSLGPSSVILVIVFAVVFIFSLKVVVRD